MKTFKINKQGTIVKFLEEDKKFIAEFAITDSIKYTTKEWIKLPTLGKCYLLVESDKEVFKLFQN